MECDKLLKTIGERVRTLRKSQSISQERLAELAGLHPVYISHLECGRRRASICTYNSVAEALGVSLSELVELPTESEVWDSNLVSLFQIAKKLERDKQIIFVETVRGVLNGLDGM